MFEAYLCIGHGAPFTWSLIRTHDYDVALEAFAHLVGCGVLDSTSMSAVLRCRQTTLAIHRFAAEPGTPDNWRGRVHTLSTKGDRSARG